MPASTWITSSLSLSGTKMSAASLQFLRRPPGLNQAAASAGPARWAQVQIVHARDQVFDLPAGHTTEPFVSASR
jgi:hypothetical protein